MACRASFAVFACLIACSNSSVDTGYQSVIGPVEAQNVALVRPSESPLRLISQQVPTFAGYYCEEGNLVVLDTMMSGAAAALISDQTLESCQLPKPKGTLPAAQAHVIERPAQYTFQQLTGWRDILSPAFLEVEGSIGIYIDYRSNRLIITGSDVALQAGLGIAASYSIPTGSITSLPGGELVSDFTCVSTPTDVRHCYNPIPGGVIFAFSDNGSNLSLGRCTIGFAGRLLTGSGWQAGWLVNSHCTPRIFRNDGVWAWQPGAPAGLTLSLSDFIGGETVDPNGWSCSGGRECRYSDAAWITASPNSPTQTPQRGLIAHGRFSPLTALNPTSPRFSIASTRVAVLGMTVHKVGQKSGHSYAAVSVVCGDFNRNFSEGGGTRLLRMICQDRAPYLRDNGDSGAPVFFKRGDGTVDAVGIHWGGDFDGMGNPGIYSPWDNVITDIGLIGPYPP